MRFKPNLVKALFLFTVLNSILIYSTVINFGDAGMFEILGYFLFIQLLVYVFTKNSMNEFTIVEKQLLVENKWRFVKKEGFQIDSFFKCYSTEGGRFKDDSIVLVLKAGGDIEFNTGSLSRKTKVDLVDELNRRINLN